MSRASTEPSLRIAIVGAGMSGLAAARALAGSGHSVQCFDKARGVGGRTSLRRAGPVTFDHGAQYFTARDPEFRLCVDGWIDEGVVAPWRGRIAVIDEPGAVSPGGEGGPAERFVGLPGMNAMAKHMARGLDVQLGSLVTSLERDGSSWKLEFDNMAPVGGFDGVLIATPPVQAVRLLSPVAGPDSHLLAAAKEVQLHPCWAAMVAFETPFTAPFDGAFVNTGDLSWVCRNSAKPGRPEGDTWVLHASPEWTERHLDATGADVASALVQEFERVTDTAAPRRTHTGAHRWMFSGTPCPREDGALFDHARVLGIAGDWLGGSKVQGAWLSGRALAGHVMGHATGEGRES